MLNKWQTRREKKKLLTGGEKDLAVLRRLSKCIRMHLLWHCANIAFLA